MVNYSYICVRGVCNTPTKNYKYPWKEDYFTNNPTLTAADYIVQRGYILIHCPSLWGPIEVTQGDRPKTKAQREFLYDYFMNLGEKERANEYIKEEE